MKQHLPNRILVTGGAGFIGSAFIRHALSLETGCSHLVNLDLMTYAAHPGNLKGVQHDPRYHFIQGDIRDESLVMKLVSDHAIDTIVHFAALTHVDHSITDPTCFYATNVGGTLSLLEVVRRNPHIHFHHISTDEVFGSLSTQDPPFSESSHYRPNSPYSASKAAADHFVRAYTHTYGISTTLSHCSNNYGPCQHPEKLIPKVLFHLFHKTPIPVYGTGKNIRDWLYVEDHADALWKILTEPHKSGVFAIGGNCESNNLDLIHLLISLFAEIQGVPTSPYLPLISFVEDRKGHDLRYAINTEKIEKELLWKPKHNFREGLKKTVAWYLAHPERLKV